MENINLECSSEITENIFNKGVILVRIKDQLFCFSVSYIQGLINEKPFLITQLRDKPSFMFKEDGSLSRVTETRQNTPIQQILKLNDNIAVKYDFINAFIKGRNTFDLLNPEKIKLFRDRNFNSYSITVYDSKAINRQDLLSNQEIQEEMKINLQNEYMLSEKNIPSFEEVEENNLQKCRNHMDTFRNDLKFNNDLIMMFIEGKESVVFCFSIEELKEIIEVYINETTKRELRNGDIIFKLYNFEVWINITMLEKLLKNEKANTIMLVKKGDYYEPVKSSRKVIFEENKNDFSDEISSFNVDQTEFYDSEDGFRYRKRKFYFTNEGQTQTTTGALQSIEWIRYKLDDPNTTKRKSPNSDEPAYIEFDLNGNKTVEEYPDNFGNKKAVYFENGIETKEYWLQENNNFLQYGEFFNDEMFGEESPNVINYYENGNKKSELWLTGDGKFFTRSTSQPNFIKYFSNGNIMSESILNKDSDFLPQYEWIEHLELTHPNFIKYYENSQGVIESKKWFNTDMTFFQRMGDFPNEIEYYETKDEIIKRESWRENKEDYLQRKNGLPNQITYHETKDKIISTESWRSGKTGFLQRANDLPNKIFYHNNPNGKIINMFLWMDSKGDKDNIMLQRKNGLPNKIKFFENNNDIINVEYWFDSKEKMLQRENGLPNLILYFETKEKIIDIEKWLAPDKTYLNRGDLPNRIEYYQNPNKKLIKSIIWRSGPGLGLGSENFYQRENNLPNYIEYYENENKIIKAEKWFDPNGVLIKEVLY